MTDEEAPELSWSGCLAGLLFAGAIGLVALVVSIGLAYGSGDWTLAFYAGVLLVGPALAGAGVWKRRPLVAAVVYVGIVAIAFLLGSSYG